MEERQDLISRQAAADVVDFECGEWRGLAKTIIDKLEALSSAQPERKSVWHKTYDDGFPAESDQVLVTDGKNFWVDESVANDVGLEWACFDGCWEDTEWAFFNDLYRMFAQLRKRGKWIQNENGTWSCDQCQSWIPDEQHYYAKYCLCCGSQMEDGEDDVKHD